jgi:menaquinone-dependent protoporphyrinogen oxidase
MKYLIGFISKTGTTEEIARRIGQILAERGAEIDVKPIASISDIAGYDRIVLGSPVNAMKVLPEFNVFLNEKIVGRGVPVDLFIVSYLFEKGRKMLRKAILKDKERLRVLVKPESLEIFAGRLPGPLPGAARFFFGTARDLPLDLRDWAKIEAWAHQL